MPNKSDTSGKTSKIQERRIDRQIAKMQDRMRPPPDDIPVPEPWVCDHCGNKRQPIWIWQEQRYAAPYAGDCEVCQARKDGEMLEDLQRQAAAEKYGLLEGVRAHMRLDTYKPDPAYPSQATALRSMQELVVEWLNGNWSAGRLLVGQDVGTGKTHLAIGAAYDGLQFARRRSLQTDDLLAIYTVPALIDRIKSTYNKDATESQDSIMELLKRPMILVLDDLGVEAVKSEDWYQGLWFPVFDDRWSKEKATIITSNITSAEAMLNLVGRRVMSRMVAMTGPAVVVRGKDYRQRKHKKG